MIKIIKKKQLSIITALCIAGVLTGCGNKIDYSLPADPIAFNTDTYVSPSDSEDTFRSIEYNGRIYIPFGTQKGNITADDLGECLGYVVQDGEKLEDSRIFLLAGDPDVNFLVEFSTQTLMNPPMFLRAIDTLGEDITIPSFVEDLGYNYWKGTKPMEEEVLEDTNAQMMLINENINKWMNYDPNLSDWYNTYAVTDFDDDGYLEICVCKTYNNGPSSIISIYEVTEKGIMTEFDTGLMDDYPDLVIDHYTEPIGFVRDDEGNCIYHVCNIVDNGIEGAEHRYGAMYFENNTMRFDEITEEEYNDNEEEVTLGWFTDITSENISDSYNTFVN